MYARSTRRELLNGACGAAAAQALAGCGTRTSGREPVEIRYWTGWTGHELESQKRLVDEFNRAHPGIRVRILSVAGSYQKVRIAFAGGATPDVCSAIWADELAGYAMRGVLHPLDDFLTGSGRSIDEFVPGVARMVCYQDRTYALAVTTNTNFIVFNKTIFREAGLDPERPPRTIADLDAAAQACTRLGPGGSILRYGFRPAQLLLWAYVFGGRWYDAATGRVTADDPHNVEALRWMAAYAKRYDVTRMQSFESGFGGNSTPSGPFFVGKVAMWQTGEFAREHLRRYAPNLEWGWFPLPAPPGGRPQTTSAGGSVFAIPAATRHPAEAWTFLDWITQPHAIGEFCSAITNLPPLKALGESERFRKEPLFRFALELAGGENVFGPPGMPIWPRYVQDIRRIEDHAIFGGEDPA
ncbi:MAG: N-Acetyl-D-glucosamine transport system, permease protein 1, partial [Armatimonadetes bacterium]|nr:N-Acetyl-D-glucosamine transport system, permease protein 1 [Armatimonadota bacterium]